ncbi:MAG: enoyl-CoA hydratase-related protein [Bacteroidota bacterium]|nr:enoyl-CoA hydratase-related protein [Bacteroidota bacterium]
MDYQILKPERFGAVEVLTISRPKALNALNSAFFEELNTFLDDIVANDPIRVLVITGEGKAFVAGADISEMVDLSPSVAKGFSEKGQQTFLRIERLPIPVIAAVNGYALGGGCELAMACDIRIASKKALFGLPEVGLGLIPGYAGTQRLPRLVGLGNALMCMMTGDAVSAEEAFRMGLVQQLAEPEELAAVALKLAEKIASRGPKAVRNVKEVTRGGLHLTTEKALDLEKSRFSELFIDEGKVGMKAFLNKEKPKWD